MLPTQGRTLPYLCNSTATKICQQKNQNIGKNPCSAKIVPKAKQRGRRRTTDLGRRAVADKPLQPLLTRVQRGSCFASVFAIGFPSPWATPKPTPHPRLRERSAAIQDGEDKHAQTTRPVAKAKQRDRRRTTDLGRRALSVDVAGFMVFHRCHSGSPRFAREDRGYGADCGGCPWLRRQMLGWRVPSACDARFGRVRRCHHWIASLRSQRRGGVRGDGGKCLTLSSP